MAKFILLLIIDTTFGGIQVTRGAEHPLKRKKNEAPPSCKKSLVA